MAGTPDLYDLVTLMYIGGMGITMYRLIHSWKVFWSDSPDLDVRQLATWTALFLITPLGILLQGLAQVVAASAMGRQIYGLSYSLFAFNVHRALGSPEGDWYIALAGNAATYVLGIFSLALGTFGNKLGRPLRLVLMDTGIVELAWTLICRPLMELSSGAAGDWAIIYSFKLPFPSGIILGGHILSLVAYFLFLSRSTELQSLRFRVPDAPA